MCKTYLFFPEIPEILCLIGVSLWWASPMHVNRSLLQWQHDVAQQSFMAQWARAFSAAMMSWLAAIAALSGTYPGLYFTTIYYSRVWWCLINLHKLNIWGERFQLLQRVTGARLLLNWNSTHCMSSHMYLLWPAVSQSIIFFLHPFNWRAGCMFYGICTLNFVR